jgi:hypothetical protein
MGILIFFYCASVSKSLLTVIGTFSLPAKLDRGKCPIEQISMSRPHFPPSFYFNDYLPAISHDGNWSQTARGVRATPHTPRFSVIATLSSRQATTDLFAFRFSAHYTAQAVCPCQGTWHDNLQLGLYVKCPISVCLAWRRSLDNSCPPCSSRRSSGKTKKYFVTSVRNARSAVLLTCALCEPSNCAASQAVIECAPLVKG